MTKLEVERQQQIIEISKECIRTGATVRELGEKYSVPKTTVHEYLTKYLPEISGKLAKDVRKVLDKNKADKIPQPVIIHMKKGQIYYLLFYL